MSDLEGNTNPYIPHYHVTELQDLYGRHTIFVELKTWIKVPRESRGIFCIYGGHKIGKSSVLYCFPHNIGNESGSALVVYYDLSDQISGDVDGLISKLQEKIAKQSPSSWSRPVTTRARRQSFKEWLQLLNGRQLYLLLDSYDRFRDASGEEEELFELLAEWLKEGSCGGYAFATCLYREKEQDELITRLKTRAVNARMRVGDIMKTEDKKDLELLEEGDARELIRQARDQGATLSPFYRSDEKFILKQAGCHPYWLQSLCHCLYEEYKKCGLVPRAPGLRGAVVRLMKPRAIWRCRRKVLQRVRKEYLDTAFSWIWDWHLASGTLQATLIEIAGNPGIEYRKKPEAFIDDVKRLKREGLVQERKGGKVAITGRLFEAFVCEREKPPDQRRWNEPCSPFRQRFGWLFSWWRRFGYVLMLVLVGLVAIFRELVADLIAELVKEPLQPVWEKVRSVASGLPVLLKIVIIGVLIVIAAIIGCVVLKRRND